MPSRSQSGSISRSTSRRTRLYWSWIVASGSPTRRARSDCVLQLGRLERWEPGPADLPFPHERRERTERLLQRRLTVELVVLVDVDPVGAETPQRLVERPADVGLGAARQLALEEPERPPLRCAVERLPAPLRGDHDLVPSRAERLAEEAFAVHLPVQISGVEEVHAQVERCRDDLPRLGEADPQAEGIATEAQHRDLRPAVT